MAQARPGSLRAGAQVRVRPEEGWPRREHAGTFRAMGTNWVRTAAAVAGALAIAAALVLHPHGVEVSAILAWARGAGVAGALAFAGAYVAASALFLPIWPITLAAGFVYGPLAGAAVAWTSAALAGAAVFLAGRTFARGPIARAVAQRPRLCAFEAALAARGFRLVLLLRLSPIFPFGLVSCALGATRIRLREFLLASAAGTVPAILLCAQLGAAAANAAELADVRPGTVPAGRILFGLGLLATAAATGIATHAARRALDRAAPGEPAPAPGGALARPGAKATE